MMAVYKICDLDKAVNRGQMGDTPKAIREIEKYIKEKIDPKFPINEFRDWLNSDSEKPFKANRNKYFWN